MSKNKDEEDEEEYQIREPTHLPKTFDEYAKREKLKNPFGLKNPIYSLRNNPLVKEMLMTQTPFLGESVLLYKI